MRWKALIILLSIKFFQQVSFSQQTTGWVEAKRASEKYGHTSFFQRIFIGTNYRKEWQTPVAMPVFDIRKTNLKIVGMGGGQQTTSLELIDDKGREWSLRSVDKDVKLAKKFMQNTFIEKIVQDAISASYPYAGLSVPVISNAAGVVAGEQSLYYVPDDTIFGEHRKVMANKVFILVNDQPQAEKEITTEEMLQELQTGTNSKVDQPHYLKARLVDWLISDWDRHDGQYRWIEKTTNTGTIFQVAPKDRDQAFFSSNGLLVKFVALFFMPHLNKFTMKPTGIKGLSVKRTRFDKMFTGQLTKQDWERIIMEFQNNITDHVIETAIRRQPKEIFAIRGEELIKKLKSRRDGLLEEVMKYHSFLQSLNRKSHS